jgi:hypothetical protein
MAATTVADYTSVHGEYVESVTIVRTDSQAYPSGWKYSLHYGRLDGATLLRYDNAHEPTNGHERHTGDTVESIRFPGMKPLYDRFQREIDRLPPREHSECGSETE